MSILQALGRLQQTTELIAADEINNDLAGEMA